MVEKGLLDIWGRLGEYRDFLVVIGGLVPRYITAPEGTSDYDATSLNSGIFYSCMNWLHFFHR